MCRLRVTLHSEFWNPLYKSWPSSLTEVLTSHASKHLVKWHAEHLHMFLCMSSVCLRLLLQIRRPSTNNRTIGKRKFKGSKSCHRAEKALSTAALTFFSSPDFGILYGFMVSSKWTYGHPLCFTRCPNEVKIHLRKSETLQIPSMQRRHEMQRMDLILQVVTPKSTPLPMSGNPHDIQKLKAFACLVPLGLCTMCLAAYPKSNIPIPSPKIRITLSMAWRILIQSSCRFCVATDNGVCPCEFGWDTSTKEVKAMNPTRISQVQKLEVLSVWNWYEDTWTSLRHEPWKWQ